MDNIYVGKAKIVTTTFGEIIKVNLCVSDIPKEHIRESEKSGKKYLNLDVQQMKNPDKYGNTHTVKINTWRPDSQNDDPPF